MILKIFDFLEFLTQKTLFDCLFLPQDFVPFFGKLPMFLMRLATEVNWDEEEDCLDGICQEIARFCCVSTDTRSQYDVIQHIKEAGTENGENRSGASLLDWTFYLIFRNFSKLFV